AHEVAVESVSAPPSVAAGQAFEVVVRVTSTVAEGAQLSLYQDDALLDQRDVTLQPGSNDFHFPVTAQAQGFHSYQAVVAAADDRWADNNAAAGITIVQSPPRVLIVAGAPDDGEPLRVALAAAHA